MTTGTSILPELRIAVANFGPGGIDAGSTGCWEQMARWDKAVSALRAWQPHLVLCQEISGCGTPPQDRTLSPDYDVHDVLASVGLEDAAAMAPGQRDPHDVMPAGASRGGRVDRIYLTRELAGAASRHSQQDIGGQRSSGPDARAGRSQGR